MSKYILSLLACSLLATNLYATTLNWWQFATDPKVKPVIEAMVAEFEAANSDIEVKITDLTWSHGHEKIVLAFASGQAPDIVELGSDWIAQFAEAGHLANVGPDIASDSSEYQGWSMANWEGSTYGIPWYLGTRVIYYNTDLLVAAGFDRTHTPITDDEFKKVVLRMDSVGTDIHGWGANSPEKHRLYKKFMPFFWTAGAQILSDDHKYCVISSDYAILALDYYLQLCLKTGYIANQRGIEDAFIEGKIGAIFSGDWLLKRIRKEKPDLNFSTALFPGLKYPGKSFMGGEFLSIAKQSENKEAALKFVRFMLSPANQIRFCKANESSNPSSLTAQKDPFFNDDVNRKTFIRQIRMANHPPVHPKWVHIEAIVEEAVEKVLFNNISTANALHTAQKKIADLLKD